LYDCVSGIRHGGVCRGFYLQFMSITSLNVSEREALAFISAVYKHVYYTLTTLYFSLVAVMVSQSY